MTFEVIGDGKTVWVNAGDGSCVARFSRFGIDIHNSAVEQMAGASQCLLCTHTKPTLPEWAHFQMKVGYFYGIVVVDDLMPNFLNHIK